MTKPLTELAIRSLKPKGKSYRVSDSGGLCLEVSPTGSKLWRWRYRFAGKPQMLALGKYPVVGLAKARKLRDEARELVDAGKHPTREKKAEKLRQKHANENTFEKLALAWLSLKECRLNKKYHQQCKERLRQHVFPLIGDLPISEITIPDVVNVIEKIAARGTVETARRMKQLISQTFRYAAQRGLCVHNPAADLRDILPQTEEKHHPSIPPDEVGDLIKSIKAYQGARTVCIVVQLMMLTFVRTNELIAARWEEIDWDREEWHIPAERMKTRRPHVVLLSRQAIALLKELKELTGNRDFIFYSSRSKSKHLSNGTILMALKRMGYRGRMTGHGFRSLASTILNELGYRPDAVELQLAHKEKDKVRAAYNHAKYFLERKKMMQDWADFLDRARSGDNDVLVFPSSPKKGVLHDA